MTAQRGDFDSPHTDRTTEDDDVFDAHLAGWESAPAVDIAADVREEAVARAIWDTDGEVTDRWEDESPHVRRRYRRLARAAIAADPGPDTACPTPCDGDCDADCHEGHHPRLKQQHNPATCPDTADQLRQRVHDLADRHERSAAHRERLAARWTDAERHQLADAFRRLAHQSRVEALRVRAVAGPRRDEEAGA